jgi:RNA recognition motif-containing protein
MSTESTLWMGGIEPWMNEQIIMKSFNDLGIKPTSIKMIKDKKLNINRNYCFINFDDMIEANKALIQLNGKKLPNADFNFKLNWANQNSEGNRNLYIGNLSQEIDDIELYNLFKSRYPSVHHASIITDKGISKGFGFIHFLEKEDYEKCLKEMDGYIFHNNSIIVRERKKKSQEKNEVDNNNNCLKKIGFNNNNNNINYVINNDKQINACKINNIIGLDINENNNHYGIINNSYYLDKYNFLNNFGVSNININEIKSFYPKRKCEEESTSLTDNEESIFSTVEKEQDLSSLNSNSNIPKNRKFSDNIELLENCDEKSLNKKIQESVDKMFEHYKCHYNNSECKYIYYNIFFIVSKMIVYYSSNSSNNSNNTSFSDSFVF